MFRRSRRITILAAGLAMLAVGAPLAADAAAPKDKTRTLRFYSEIQTFTLTAPDGTVIAEPPPGPPAAGTVMEINSISYKGTRRNHARRPSASDYLRCTFAESGEPDCFGYAAIDGSLLRFHGMEVIGGTGKFLGATGQATSKEHPDGSSDFKVTVKLP